jgi:hypothetical protein
MHQVTDQLLLLSLLLLVETGQVQGPLYLSTARLLPVFPYHLFTPVPLVFLL